MKKFLTLLIFALLTIVAYSQNNYQEVVYLKNGSIIRGLIIEQIPNISIKIETADNNVFVFRMDEIEKITKEKLGSGSDKRNGYIGITIGPSLPIGDFADESKGLAVTGLQLNLVNFGYFFSENYGISASWFGAANELDVEGVDPWSYGGLMVGPLISFPLSEYIEWDFRPMFGLSLVTSPELYTYYRDLITDHQVVITSGKEETSAFAFNFGTVFRFHVANKVSLLISADYFSTKPEFKFTGYDQTIETFSFGGGVAFRLK